MIGRGCDSVQCEPRAGIAAVVPRFPKKRCMALNAGIAAVVKALNPKIQVIGVEPAGANAMCQASCAGWAGGQRLAALILQGAHGERWWWGLQPA